MTTVRLSRQSGSGRIRVAGNFRWAVLVCLVSALPVQGQGGPVHWLHAGVMPPGAIGRQRLLGSGPLSGFCQSGYQQPVQIRVPAGARIAAAMGAGFSHGQNNRLLIGLQLGVLYRLQVTSIPERPGLEIFPTVEIIDRLYPPPGKALHFPIPIELTLEELELAADGNFVTRVIYLENPLAALPLAAPDKHQRWIEARPGEDPLVMADHLGRPMAILRLGGRLPIQGQPDESFLYGSPPVLLYDRPDTQNEVAQ